MANILSLHKEACMASGRSRACATCPFSGTNRSMTICDICHRAFVEGFEKGAKFIKKQNK